WARILNRRDSMTSRRYERIVRTLFARCRHPEWVEQHRSRHRFLTMPTTRLSLSTAVAYRSASFIFLFLVFTALCADSNSAQSLNLPWEFRAVSKTADPEVSQWHAAQVPGVVHTDLLRNKLIPDPFYQDNEARLQWIGLGDWEYRATLQVEPAVLAHQHVDLV